jgi:dipeptidyl aminopeptidase/acylaminoacyl peptidase
MVPQSTRACQHGHDFRCLPPHDARVCCALRPQETTVSRIVLTATLALVTAAASAQQAPLTLEQIMADPDWIAGQISLPGHPGIAPYFGSDGRSVYYELKRNASPLKDLHRIDLRDSKDSVIDATAMADADGDHTAYDDAHARAAFVRHGDIFVRDLNSGALRQITRTPQEESAPQFSADGRVLSFRSGNDWFAHNLVLGVTAPAAVLKTEKDPDDAKADDLRDLQLHLFATLKRKHDDKRAERERNEALQRGDATRAPLPFYVGDDVQIVDTQLSPDANWLLAVTSPKSFEAGKKGKLTRYVTESGYEEFEDERTRVGRNDGAPHTLWLLDLRAHTISKLGLDDLPGIRDDVLKNVREENAKAAAPKAKEDESKAKPKARDVQVNAIVFARDGAHAAVELLANDNKDRWIASIETARPKLVPQHRLHDDAWVNWNFNELGWTNDGRALWYVSEESGYAHLYTKALTAKAQALTHGQFEVSSPQLSGDGRWFYVIANAQAPGSYDIYRVAASGGELQRLTHYQGVETFTLAHDGTSLLAAHSSSYLPPQLGVVATDGSTAPRELTNTITAQYKAQQWTPPEIVQVPSTHFKGAIYAKFYKPANLDNSAAHPAVMFVHGAGYTQNVHQKFPYYFREQMFHNLLLQHGYVVLDMDYRASEGYGRDWRTAIYRQMGHPELEDLLDGKQWLVHNYNVDAKRVGIYGGSYGGFMTLMALFRAPGEFAAGAALRPVTDWTQYDHEYTSKILNTPQLDPLAYARSSPIEFAEGLRDPLLICHGVIDDNVLFEDSMRLYEKLIELHKDNFTISPYPLDRHSFTNADSWLDEYKRIYRLFETNLR